VVADEVVADEVVADEVVADEVVADEAAAEFAAQPEGDWRLSGRHPLPKLQRCLRQRR